MLKEMAEHSISGKILYIISIIMVPAGILRITFYAFYSIPRFPEQNQVLMHVLCIFLVTLLIAWGYLTPFPLFIGLQKRGKRDHGIYKA